MNQEQYREQILDPVTYATLKRFFGEEKVAEIKKLKKQVRETGDKSLTVELLGKNWTVEEVDKLYDSLGDLLVNHIALLSKAENLVSLMQMAKQFQNLGMPIAVPMPVAKPTTPSAPLGDGQSLRGTEDPDDPSTWAHLN